MIDPIDEKVGARIRELRLERGKSQTELGVALGVSYQQVQKYESGENRVSASRIVEIAVELGAPIDALFQDIQTPREAVAQLADDAATQVASDWSRIENPTIRDAMRRVIQSFGRRGAAARQQDKG